MDIASPISVTTTKSENNVPLDRQERFVKNVYSVVDDAIACELDHLRTTKGIIPTCESGCSHCCRHHILTNGLEAHAMARYIKREFSKQQITDLRMRTQQWHVWDRRMPGRYPRKDMDGLTDLSNYKHLCPLIVNGACSAYQARPVVCRIHYVSSPVLSCCDSRDRTSSAAAPATIRSIETAARPFSRALKDHIVRQGLDFSRSVMLLPHWLAEEMEWNFDEFH